MKQEIKAKLKKVKVVLLDVDGVLTDGGIYYTNKGDEIKKFNVKDGSGIKMAIRAGYKFAIVTGRVSNIVLKRATELGIDNIYQGVKQKHTLINDIKRQFKVNDEEIAFIADDIIDLELFKKVGVRIAVADAHKMIKRYAHIITKASGGDGAVREFIDMLLDVNGLWEKAVEQYL